MKEYSRINIEKNLKRESLPIINENQGKYFENKTSNNIFLWWKDGVPLKVFKNKFEIF